MREELTSIAYVDCACGVEECLSWVWEAIPSSAEDSGPNSVQDIIIDAWYNKEHIREDYKYTIYFVPRYHDVPEDKYLRQVQLIKAILKALRDRECRVYFITWAVDLFPEEDDSEG